jgi:hypothetical protein
MGIFLGYTAANNNILYLDLSLGLVKQSHHAQFDKACYLEATCPLAAQLLYNLGVELDNIYHTATGPLTAPLPSDFRLPGTIKPIVIPWPPLPPSPITANTGRSHQHAQHCLSSYATWQCPRRATDHLQPRPLSHRHHYASNVSHVNGNPSTLQQILILRRGTWPQCTSPRTHTMTHLSNLLTFGYWILRNTPLPDSTSMRKTDAST